MGNKGSKAGLGLERTARGPLRATKFLWTLSIALSGITVLPLFNTGVTSTDSHSIGAWNLLLGVVILDSELANFGCCEDVFDGL